MISKRTLFRQYTLLLLFFFSLGVTAQNSIYYVSPTGSGTGDGSSWENAMTLANALNAAQAGDQIWVQGFETVTRESNLYVTPAKEGFTLKSGVRLYGGFAGTETSIDQRETLNGTYQMKYRSVLTGDIGRDDAYDNTKLIFPENTTRADNATHVLTLNMSPSSGSNNNGYPTVVNGLSIGGGQATGGVGGGIYIYGDNTGGGNYRIERCFITHNYATEGGGVYVAKEVNNVSGESLINQCVVYNNAAGVRSSLEDDGGGIFLAGGGTVVNCAVFNNENGGMSISADAKVVNCTVARNSGGGIDMSGSSTDASVFNTVVWGNSSVYSVTSPVFKSSAYPGAEENDGNGNLNLNKYNYENEKSPCFESPSSRTGFDRDFDWAENAYPLWSWDIQSDSYIVDKGNNNYYDGNTYGAVDITGNTRVSGPSISIGAYEYQYLPASRIRYVKPNATGDGTSWDNASGDLQKMIDELAENNPQNQAGEVWMAAGTYVPNVQIISNSTYSASFRMRDGISVYGGFEGTETSRRERAKGTMPWMFTNRTVLQGSYYTPSATEWNESSHKWGVNSDSRHVVFFAPLPSEGKTSFDNITTLNGVTIQGGYAQGGTGATDFLTDRGAGVYMVANAYLSECIVTENLATGNGGGVYLHGGRVINSLVYNNSSDSDGGGIYVENAGLVLASMVSNNSASNGAGVYMDHTGVWNDGVSHPEYMILSTSVVSNNTSRQNGAVYCDQGGVVQQSTIVNNVCPTATDNATSNASQTGGIYINEYALVLNSVLWNNLITDNNVPMYAKNPTASKVRFLYNGVSGINNAVWNNTLQQEMLTLSEENSTMTEGVLAPGFDTSGTSTNITGSNIGTATGVQGSWKMALDGSSDGIDFFWKPVTGSNLRARGMTLGGLPSEVLMAPELDISNVLFAQKPSLGAFNIDATQIKPDDTGDALTVYVDAECTYPDHDGSSWGMAYRSLNEAISYLAGLGSDVVGGKSLRVCVLEGDLWPRYAYTNLDPKTATIDIPVSASGQTIEIYGGYHRTTDNNTVERNPLTYRSVINGNHEGKDIAEGYYHCITVAAGAKALLDGFHIINGYASGEASRQYGAGLLVHDGAEVTVSNCIFENNTAVEGAAIDARNATLTMNNCVVNNNTNTTETEAIINCPTLTMNHVTVANNKGKAPDNMGTSSFSVGNTEGTNSASLASVGADGANNFANPTNVQGATLGFDTYLGGYSEFRPLTSSADAGNIIINRAYSSTSLTNDITVVNDRNLGGVPDLGAYESDLPKTGRVYYVRTTGNDNNTGLSWDQAFATVRKAVETAYNGAVVDGKRPQVWVAAGTYAQSPKSGSVNCFEILEGVDVFGAFPKEGNPGFNDKHPFISNSIHIEGNYLPEEYETILKPLSTSGNRRVLGQADTYNPINAAIGGDYVDVGAGNGNYIYQESDEYNQVEDGQGDYIYSNGGEYVSAASDYCNSLKVENDGWYKYVTNYERSANDGSWFRPTTKYFVYVGDGKGTYTINGNRYYSDSANGNYVEFGEEGLYETASGVGYESKNGYVTVPDGKGQWLCTESGYNKVGTGYGNYVLVLSAGYHEVEQGQGSYIFRAENRFGIETIWDGFTLTEGYLDSNSLPYLDDNGKRNGGAGAAIFTNVVLKDCIIIENTNLSNNTGKEIRGGGVYCDEGRLENCYILNNTLGRENQYTAYGGGAYMYNGTAYNCVISQNQTLGQHTDGAAIFIENGEFFNNTIVANVSNGTSRGNGGICVYYKQDESQKDSKLRVYNCISIANTSRNRGALVGYDDAAANGGSMECYNSIFGVNPVNQSNGASVDFVNCLRGTTDNLFVDMSDGNYRLSSQALALNKGENLPEVNGVEINLAEYTDMDYTDRIKDCTIDIGAYERNNQDNVKPDNNGNYYVTQNGSGTASGESPANAACAMKLQEVLNAAGERVQTNPTATVKIAGYEGGTFVYHANTLSNADDPQSYTYVVPEGITVEGGYTEDFKTRNPKQYNTILSAIKEATASTQEVNGYHVITFKPASVTSSPSGQDALTKTTIIDGLYLIDGLATSMAGTGNSKTQGGGAIVPSGAHVRNCVITQCEAVDGGGLYVLPGGMVSGCAIIDNVAERGAGVYADNTNVTGSNRAHVISCTVTDNTASSTGGGIYLEDGAVMVLNSVFWGNTAPSDKNVSGVLSETYSDALYYKVFTGLASSADDAAFYPFNDCYVEKYEMPTNFENVSMSSEEKVYFASTDRTLKAYSPLIKHGLSVGYYTDLQTECNLSTVDMQGYQRVQQSATRVDVGAYAFEGGVLPTDLLIKRIFVSKGANVTLPDNISIDTYIGRSFYTSVNWVDDALEYINEMRNNPEYANEKFEILIASGTYKPSMRRTDASSEGADQRQNSYVIPHGVSVYGGFRGDELISSTAIGQPEFTSIPNVNGTFTCNGDIKGILAAREYSDFNQNGINDPWEFANQTVLSGKINVSLEVNNVYHVLYSDASKVTDPMPVVLDGLTVMDGETSNVLSNVADKDELGRGGGLYTNKVPYVINRCRFMNNLAVRGGAVYARDAKLTIVNSIFAGNGTVDNPTTEGGDYQPPRGGAVYIAGIDKENPTGALYAVNTLWVNNETAGQGGAIGTNYTDGLTTFYAPTISLMNNTFACNKAKENAVLYHYTGKNTMTNTMMWGNVSESESTGTNESTLSASYCASDRPSYLNGSNNIALSTENMAVTGPRFTKPSAVAGVAGNDANNLWNPASISALTDAGDGTYYFKTGGGISGAYKGWMEANALDYATQYMGYADYLTSYLRYSGPLDEKGNEEDKPIDIGFYEYQYSRSFPEMDAIYVATVESGLADGSSWANATSNLRDALIAMANPTGSQVSPPEKNKAVYIKAGEYSLPRLSAGTAYTVSMSTSNEFGESLTIKGSYNESGVQDFSQPTVITTQDGNADQTTTLMSVAANDKPVLIEGLTFINKNNTTTGGNGMTAGTTGGTLTLKQTAFRGNKNSGVEIVSGSAGKILLVNTLFADGSTGLKGADNRTTVVNATFANNVTDLTTAASNNAPTVYNSVSWNNGTQNLLTDVTNSNVSIEGTVANDDVNNGPNFRDPNNTDVYSRDYRIRPSVKLLNKGNKDNYQREVGIENFDSETDLANNTRLVDTDIDVGAYEYEAPLQPIVYVKSVYGGAGDGKSWETALTDLQGAVDLAGLYAQNHSDENANGYVFVHGNYTDTDRLNITLGNTKVYGSMNDERSDKSLGDSYTTTDVEVIVSDLLGKRKGVLESTQRSSLADVTVGADAVVDGFVIEGATAVNDGGVLSTSVVENDVTGAAGGLLYNSLVLGDGTDAHQGNVSTVKTVNVTATGTINGAAGSGNNRGLVAAADTNTYVAGPYWNYQLMETAVNDIDKGVDGTTQLCIGLAGHSRDLIGNLRIRNTVDNGCFETWNICEDMTSGNVITATDYPVGKSVVYVRKNQELKIQNASDGTLVYKDATSSFTPGFLLLEHKAGIRGNRNHIRLTNFAVERDIPIGGADLVAMPFEVDAAKSVMGGITPKLYSGSTRAAYDYKFDGTNGSAWQETSIDLAGLYVGLLFENNTGQGQTLRFYGVSSNPYIESGVDKTVSLEKYNYNDAWSTDNPGTGNRFTHKENMSWNLFGSPYLCAMNYSDMEYGRVIYGYADGYTTVNTANATKGYIPAGSAVFTQTATLKESETFSVAQPVVDKSGDEFEGLSQLNIGLSYSAGTRSGGADVMADVLQLNTVEPSEAKADFDIAGDGVKWMAVAGSAPQIYAERGSGRYSLLSAVSNSGKVNVGLTLPVAGSYTIGLPADFSTEDFEAVVLHDAVTGRSTDLLADSYDFMVAAPGDVTGRFTVSFKSAVADKSTDDIKVWSPAPATVAVSGVADGDLVRVYSASGVLAAQAVASSSTLRLSANVSGVAVVDVVRDGHSIKVAKTTVRVKR